MKKYKVREKSIAWYAKELIQVLGMAAAIIGILILYSATAADDLKEHEIAYATEQTGESIKEAEKVAETGDLTPETTAAEWISLGDFEITAYCPCERCCNKTDGITASGAKAEEGKTIAVDPDVIPYGTEVKIDGHTYIAQDTGGVIKNNRIDVYMSSHSDALKYGVKYQEVFVKKGDADD